MTQLVNLHLPDLTRHPRLGHLRPSWRIHFKTAGVVTPNSLPMKPSELWPIAYSSTAKTRFTAPASPRAKVTHRIGYAHTLKHPASGGFINGQSLMVLLRVTAWVSIPIEFLFYQPDPV